MSLLLTIPHELEALCRELAAQGVLLDPVKVAEINETERIRLESEDADCAPDRHYLLHQSEGLKITGFVEEHEPETIWISFGGAFDRYRPIEKRMEQFMAARKAARFPRNNGEPPP